MELKELLDVANEGYPDGYLSHYYDEDGNLKDGHGDTLARFIVIEIIETYAPGESDRKQLETAVTAIERAKKNTEGVIRPLKRRKRPLKWGGGKSHRQFSLRSRQNWWFIVVLKCDWCGSERERMTIWEHPDHGVLTLCFRGCQHFKEPRQKKTGRKNPDNHGSARRATRKGGRQ